MNNKKRILICPLDWGLGHATRCIPIINHLLENNSEVIIVVDKRPFALLKEEFPTLEFITIVDMILLILQKAQWHGKCSFYS